MFPAPFSWLLPSLLQPYPCMGMEPLYSLLLCLLLLLRLHRFCLRGGGCHSMPSILYFCCLPASAWLLGLVWSFYDFGRFDLGQFFLRDLPHRRSMTPHCCNSSAGRPSASESFTWPWPQPLAASATRGFRRLRRSCCLPSPTRSALRLLAVLPCDLVPI